VSADRDADDDRLVLALRLLRDAERLLRVVVDERMPPSANIDQAFLDTDPRDLDFGPGTTSRLRFVFDNGPGFKEGRINTVRELIACDVVDFLRSPNIGRGTVNVLQEVLKYHGVQLGMTL